MPDDELPQDADFDQVNSSLNQSLKTCRSMITNYRAFLSDDEAGEEAEGEQSPREPRSFEKGSGGN